MTDAALTFTAPESVALQPITVGQPDEHELLVDTVVSAVSSGTEGLIYRGELRSDLRADEVIDALDTEFAYPIRYGYAAAGVVSAVGAAVSDDWIGRQVFAFHPHQTRFLTTPDDVVPLPAALSPERGSLFPAVETATNIVLDATPELESRVVVFGAGVIGLCVSRLLAAFPLADLVVVDPIERRRQLASQMGADLTMTPEQVTETIDDADLAIELSGSPAALDAAIAVVRYDARIVVGSWYGTKRAPIDLGGRFHRDRIEIVSSQVSTISPELRGRWSRERRTETALDWLERIDIESLITHRIPFQRAADAYELVDESPETAVQVVLEYT